MRPAVVVPLPSHSTEDSEGDEPEPGAVVSSTVKVALAKLDRPHASVAVNATVSAPVAPHRSLRPVLPWLQDPLVHPLSLVAMPPPLLVSHAPKDDGGSAPSHSTVESLTAVANVGAASGQVHSVTGEVKPLFPRGSVRTAA